MKEILVIVASGKKNGNTDKLANAFIDGAKEAGHRVNKAFLGEMQIGGCNGCNACKITHACAQKDDMSALYPLIERADGVVLASPLYFWTISARLKAFIERLYAISQEDDAPPLGRYERYPEKECALLMTAADDYFWTFEQADAYYQFALIHYLGWKDRGKVLAGGCGGSPSPRRIEQTPHLRHAYELGKRF